MTTTIQSTQDTLICTPCGQAVALRREENHSRLSAMQMHDQVCAAHGAPCTHSGACYQWQATS